MSNEKLSAKLAEKLSREMHKFYFENENQDMSEVLTSGTNALMLCLAFQIKMIAAGYENSHEIYAELAKDCFIYLLQQSGEQLDMDEMINM